jgi:maleate cis-trans isomerase
MATSTDGSVERWMRLLTPRFKYGNILPPGAGGVRRGEGYQFYRLVPLDVLEITTNLGIRDYTPEGVEEAIANFWNCVDGLVKEDVDWIVLGGAPVSSQLGRPRVLDLIRQVKDKTGRQMDTPMEAIIAAAHHLGAKRVVVASRWADQLNDALCAYLRAGGLDVLGVTTRGQWAGQAFGMAFEEGLRTALEVAREAARLAPGADAIIAPGGAAMSLHVIPAIEEEFGKPVLTNLNSEVWNALIHPGIIDPVTGWGRLVASP